MRYIFKVNINDVEMHKKLNECVFSRCFTVKSKNEQRCASFIILFLFQRTVIHKWLKV